MFVSDLENEGEWNMDSREIFAKGHLAILLIRGLYFAIENDIKDKLKIYNLTYPSFRILWILYFDKSMTMSSLAYLAQTNISNVFRQLIKLKKDGLVTVSSGIDARIKEASLTKEGREILSTIIEDQATNTDLESFPLLTTIPKEELEIFFKVAIHLCNKLIGQPYIDWTLDATNKIQEK